MQQFPREGRDPRFAELDRQIARNQTLLEIQREKALQRNMPMPVCFICESGYPCRHREPELLLLMLHRMAQCFARPTNKAQAAA